MNEQNLIQIAVDHPWYPIACAVILFVTQLLKREPLRAYLWAKIPNGWQWTVPVAQAVIAGCIKGLTEGLPPMQVAASAATVLVLSAVPAMGLNGGLTNSKLPWGNPKPEPIDLSDQAITDRIPGPPPKPTRIGVDE